MKEINNIVSWEKLVPIVLGVALSGLGTLMNFAYESIDELHNELVEHRLSLSRLISPDGKLIQSPTSAKSKEKLIETLNKMQQDIVRLETQVKHLEGK